jgi:hypothetical protein
LWWLRRHSYGTSLQLSSGVRRTEYVAQSEVPFGRRLVPRAEPARDADVSGVLAWQPLIIGAMKPFAALLTATIFLSALFAELLRRDFRTGSMWMGVAMGVAVAGALASAWRRRRQGRASRAGGSDSRWLP